MAAEDEEGVLDECMGEIEQLMAINEALRR